MAKTIQSFFVENHRLCDNLWSAVEAAADASRLDEARTAWASFDAAMRRHFSWEEETLFPAVEEATGMKGMGPTAVMRMEHGQMRALLDQMDEAAKRGDLQALLDHGDTLLMVIQQHNVKEEGILYPMADHVLQGRSESILSKLQTAIGAPVTPSVDYS